MKLTRHNGRSGKHGTYNPRHNDRRFDVENSEHIDAQRARKNVYWDCYRGFTTSELRENPEQPDFRFCGRTRRAPEIGSIHRKTTGLHPVFLR